MAAELPRSTNKPALAGKPSAATKSHSHSSFEMLIQPPPPQFRGSGSSNVVYSDFYRVPRGRYRSCCSSICACACIGIFSLTIILLLVIISYLVFLRSGLPDVNITKLEVYNSQKMESILELELKVSNQNQKLELVYGPLAIDVTNDDVKLRKTGITGFRQNPQNDTSLDVQMKVYNAGVNPNAARNNQSESNNSHEEAVFDVYMSGTVGFEVGTVHMITVPFLSACYEVKSTDVRLGRRPQCHVRMFAFR
ncbi:hypothetical protein QN277_018097 [Acacia crassicarpa]|uniref:Late embryogenesis abundant protein LEA-2 subgroup domain-containing protein n=1 Tax=Acacia crassicarpa TaxID=499986 RepID=A0AAE1KIV5_9FABA|nr:hypothetical protein QN277_018097 [Acacia crassicarpa]